MTATLGAHPHTITEVRIVGAPNAEAVDVSLEGGAITAMTPAGEQPPAGEVLAGDGAYLSPGLWDAHVHFGQWAATFTRLDLSGASDARACARLLAEEAGSNPPPRGGAVIGMSYRGALWDPAPTTSLLDEVTGEVPVIAISADYHSSWLNSAAQRLFDLPWREEPVQETEWFDLLPRIDALPAADPDAGLRAALADAASRGVVGITDVDFAPNFDTWPERVARGLNALHVRAGFYAGDLETVIARGFATGDELTAGGQVRLGPLKIISDGSLNTKTAYCFDPYPGGSHGVLSVPRDELERLARRAHEHGIALAIHAIGDHANAIALDVFAATGATGSIEHAQLIRRSDIHRMAELGITASIQPAHLLDDREVAHELWPGKTPYQFTTLSKAGVTLALGSDAPVAPLDPWLAIAAAVGRGEPAWQPAERMSPASALFSSVAGAGRPRVGSPADLALLAADPLAPGITAGALREMSVRATLRAGEVTFAA